MKGNRGGRNKQSGLELHCLLLVDATLKLSWLRRFLQSKSK